MNKKSKVKDFHVIGNRLLLVGGWFRELCGVQLLGLTYRHFFGKLMPTITCYNLRIGLYWRSVFYYDSKRNIGEVLFLNQFYWSDF